jgi:replication factor C subunit 3/5
VIDFDQINVNDRFLHDLARELLVSDTPQDIIRLRTALYDLLVQCVEPIKILKGIFYAVLDHLNNQSQSDTQKYQLVQILIKYEDALKQGSKPIYPLEGMCVSIINLLNDV